MIPAKPTRRDLTSVRRALASTPQHPSVVRALAQLVADARAHGYGGHEEFGYNTCDCLPCVLAERAFRGR